MSAPSEELLGRLPTEGGSFANPRGKSIWTSTISRRRRLTLPEKARRILYFEAFGFLAILAACWLDEWSGFHSWPFKRAAEMNWSVLWVESLIILAVGISSLLITRELLGRVLYLEGFVRVCAWCRKVKHHGEWVMLEDYLHSGLDFSTSHGICPRCEDRVMADATKPGQPTLN